MVAFARKLSQSKQQEGVIPPAKDRNAAFRRVISQIPKGQVTTYGQVAAAAGYPRNHRAVAQFLRSEPPNRLPWHRVVGAGGEIKLRGEGAAEQRLRLRMEGVSFSGRRVNLKLHGFTGSPRGTRG